MCCATARAYVCCACIVTACCACCASPPTCRADPGVYGGWGPGGWPLLLVVWCGAGAGAGAVLACKGVRVLQCGFVQVMLALVVVVQALLCVF